MIYLDHAATTKPDPEGTKTMLPFLGEQFLNPSAFYQPAVRVRVKIDDARREIADFIHADPRAIFFTSGGTEADNWALRIAVTAMAGKGRHIISSPVEHPAVRNSLQYLRKLGFEISLAEINREGLVDVDRLKDMIREDTILISVMHANNEIGTIEPIEEIGKLAADRGILFHTDAVQTFGHIPIDLRKCHIDLLSASAHKLYGPKGMGLLYVRPGLDGEKLLYGGGQERGMRAGTENVPGILGFARAVRLAEERMDQDSVREMKLRDAFEKKLLEEIPGVRINGCRQSRLPGIASVTFPEFDAETLLVLLDQKGICASAGSACSAGARTPSHVLAACGIPTEESRRTLRFSLGRETKEEDLNYTVKVLRSIIVGE